MRGVVSIIALLAVVYASATNNISLMLGVLVFLVGVLVGSFIEFLDSSERGETTE